MNIARAFGIAVLASAPLAVLGAGVAVIDTLQKNDIIAKPAKTKPAGLTVKNG